MPVYHMSLIFLCCYSLRLLVEKKDIILQSLVLAMKAIILGRGIRRRPSTYVKSGTIAVPLGVTLNPEACSWF